MLRGRGFGLGLGLGDHAPIPVGYVRSSRVATSLIYGLVFPGVHEELGALKRTHSLSTATLVAVANVMYCGAAFAMVSTPLLIAHAGPAAVVTLSAALHLAWLAAALCCCARVVVEPGAAAAGTTFKGAEGNWASRDMPALSRIVTHSAAISILICTCAFSASVFSLMSWLPTFASRELRVELAQLPADARAAP